MSESPPTGQIGRFDQSFLIHMIKDFFWVLVVVLIVEFAVKAFLVWYDFTVNGEDEVAEIAEDIAGDVRDIMLNEGGPVAARTFYPILEQNWTDLGYSIAIEPSAITVASIESNFAYVPQGIPMAETMAADGPHVVGSFDLQAETFCLACHSEAAVGDVLGTVTVRNYLASDFANWWESVRLTLGLSIGKIVVHSIILFLLLRWRMEPLLRLRETVSNLARAYGGLTQRAEIRSADEFGVLARDLNLFLDRISGLVGELDAILRNVVSVNDDIVSIQGDLREQVDAIAAGTRNLERGAMMGARREPMLSEDWFTAIRDAVDALDQRLERLDGEPGDNAARTVESLRTVIAHAEAQIRTNERLFEDLAGLGERTDSFQRAMSEMVRLEERMKTIVEQGSKLVHRLAPPTDDAVGRG